MDQVGGAQALLPVRFSLCSGRPSGQFFSLVGAAFSLPAAGRAVLFGLHSFPLVRDAHK